MATGWKQLGPWSLFTSSSAPDDTNSRLTVSGLRAVRAADVLPASLREAWTGRLRCKDGILQRYVLACLFREEVGRKLMAMGGVESIGGYDGGLSCMGMVGDSASRGP